MSLNAATIELLLAKGLSATDLLEVARAMEKRRDNTNAERQARYRARQKPKRRNAVTVTPVTPNDNNTLTPGSEDKSSSPNKVFVLPADIPAEPWAAFERMRDKIRKPMTDDARWLAVGKLRKLRDEDGWPPGDVLNHCTLNSYQGIYPPKGKRSEQAGKSAAAYASIVAGLSPDEPF